MSTESCLAASTTASTSSDKTPTPQEKRFRSIFDVPVNFFDGCCLLSSSTSSISVSLETSNSNVTVVETKGEANTEEEQSNSLNGAGAGFIAVSLCLLLCLSNVFTDTTQHTQTGPGDRPLAEIRLNRVTIHANPLAG